MIEYVAFQKTLIAAGSRIFAEGEEGDVAYLIERGKVVVSKVDPESGRTLVLGELREGDIFGEMALIDDTPRMATATAIEETEVHVVPRSEFTDRLESMDTVMVHILRIMMGRTRLLADFLIAQKRAEATSDAPSDC